MCKEDNYDYNDLNLHALFIGDKAENGNLYKDILNNLVDDHLGWRLNYMPGDKEIISPDEQSSNEFNGTVDHLKDVMKEVSRRLRDKSVPWQSAGRYWGHMNSETLMPAILAYNLAILWNGNNVAYESSPATSEMGEEVGNDFANLMGFDKGWGHISADGSLANLEGLWYARNIKSLPLAIKEVIPDSLKDKSEWELLNMSVDDIMDIFDKYPDEIDEIKKQSARSGKNLQKLGKLLVPQTKHYSWLKAADIIGIGLDQVVPVPVDSNYRMDINSLNEIITNLVKSKTPILGVVAVVGSTEEGAVDPVDKIVSLRNEWSEKGINFYLHVDAAYGGYGRAMFLDKNGKFIPYENLIQEQYKNHDFTEKKQYIKKEVYDAYKAISFADSVTIDPHKMGYVPYAAGGIAIKDIRMRDTISYFATYVFEKGANIPALLGAYTLEGSMAGATAASVWAAHRTLPLNVEGYGKLVGASIEGAHRYYDFLSDLSFEIGNKTIEVYPLTNPDFNMVDYVVKEKGNNSLEDMNKLNHDLYDQASYVSGNLYNKGYIVSHTDFSKVDYGDSPLSFVKSLGFTESDWNKTGKITIIRASVMTPYMNTKENFNYFAPKIKKEMKDDLTNIVDGTIVKNFENNN